MPRMAIILLIAISFLSLVPSASGQGILGRLFNGRRDRYQPYCPDCSPNSPAIPGVVPTPEPSDSELAQAEQMIPPEVRVKNRGPNCGWCALEDVFVAAGYSEFKGLRERAYEKRTSPNGIGFGQWKAQLDQARVDYNLVTNRDYSIFAALKEGIGVAIFIPKHAVVCVGLTDRDAYILDNNGDLKVQRWSRSKFDRAWEGIACCPKRKRPKPEVAPAPTPTSTVGPAGPVGPQGPAGKDGSSPDLGPLNAKIAALTVNVNSLADASTNIVNKVNNIDTRLQYIEKLAAPNVPPVKPLPELKHRIIPEQPPN